MSERLQIHNHYGNDIIHPGRGRNPAMGMNIPLIVPSSEISQENIFTADHAVEAGNGHHALEGEFVLSTPSNGRGENGNGINQAALQEWNLRYSHEKRVIPGEQITDALELIGRWSEAFPRENTWVQREYGVPSLIVRLDATSHNGKLGVYEVEERPAGIGITTLLNPEFKEHLEAMKKVWPDIGAVISPDPRRRGSDDHLWTDVIDPNEDPNKLVLVRAEPEETDFHHLVDRSISSVQEKGNKSYGEEIGLWKSVHTPDDLPWNNGFVIKPKQGSKTRDVFIWLPKDMAQEYKTAGKGAAPGAYSRSRIEKVVTEAGQNGGLYCQEFFPPMESGQGPEAPWMIYRVFFGYNPVNKGWEYMGGAWNARPNLKIHGASDAISGPVTVE